MSTDEILKRGPGFLNVATAGGIQDVSPFLPLLGTEHCEKLVTSALQNGLLYAAATPMTMFGSLGILKAGIITLWSSIDIRVFPGPTLLKNAGFVPSGHGKLLLHVAESKRNLYVAEDKLRCILSKKRIRSVEINLLSKDLVVWNVRLIAWTILLSSFGLIPYIYPIYRSLPEEPFETTWVYPLMRIAGCDIIAVTIQLLFQIRILDETYCRIRFHAMDSYFKDHGQSLPPFWDPNERARDILSKLRGLMKTPKHPNMQPNGTDGQTAASVASNSALGQSNSLLPKVDHNAARWRENLSTDVEDRLATSGLGKMSSFAFPAFVAPSRPPSIAPPSPALPSSGALQSPASADDPSAAERGEIAQTQAPPSVCFSDYPPQHFAPITQLGMEPVPSRLLAWVSESFTNVLLWATQLFLFVGIGLTFVGYIGCFTIIQATDRSDWKAPVIWLIVEAALGGIRTVLWAWNPTWDDAKSPIALEKVPSDDSDSLSVDGHSAAGTTTDFANISVEGDAAGDSKKCSYGIGWMLDSVTADDMHALIIAVNKANAKDLEDLDECTADGDRVSEYLQDTLLVPRSQIVKLYDEDATKAKIVEELKALAHRGTVAQDAPIVIYFAGHSFVSEHDNSTYFVPHRSSAEKDDPMEGCSLSYREVVDLLGHIAQEKTDTITFILDCCHAGAMGKNDKFDGNNSNSLKPPQHQRTPSARRRQSIVALQNDDSIVRSSHRAGQKRSKRKKAAQDQEILVGYSSHILLAGSRASQYAVEDRGQGGRFTRYLLQTLRENEELETMTYKKLVDEINRISWDPQRYRQEAICTTIYQERMLFNGLFSRKLDEKSSMPVITVQYSDH